MFKYLRPVSDTFLFVCLFYVCSEGHHSVQQAHEGRRLGHADPRRTGNAGFRLRVLSCATLCSSHDLSLHVSDSSLSHANVEYFLV